MSDDVIQLETVKIERDGGTTFVILNRPEKRNAMSPQLHNDMCEALDWAADDDQTKVVVITGAGGNFCSGGDVHDIIAPLTRMSMPELLSFTRMTGDLVKAMRL